MLITLKGLVIGQRIIGENSCFLDLFTDKLGMIEVMAHGAKKIGGKNSGAASLFSYATFCVSRSSKGYTLNSAEPICSFYNISADIEALSLAAYFADIIKYCATSEEEHEDLLRFTCMTYFQLEKQKLPLRFIKAIFEFRFLSRIGFMPDLRACRECQPRRAAETCSGTAGTAPPHLRGLPHRSPTGAAGRGRRPPLPAHRRV